MINAADLVLNRGDRPVMASPTVLTDLKDLASFAIERTRLPMVISDPRQHDNPIVFVNASFLEKTGYSAGEVIGRNCRFLQGGATDRGTVDRIRQALRESHTITVELLNYRKDGQPFWNQLHICPVHNSAGELVYYFASQMDVTEQRRTRELERAEHALLLEVDHRGKNALALVQAIVRLSSRRVGIEAYADAVNGRVDALAVAHALLSDAKWQSVGVERLVRRLIDAIGNRRFEVDPPGPELSPEQVQPLAVVLHELFVNVIQHGALGQEAGRCAITWRRGDGTIVISLVEDGAPIGKRARIAGFGTKIVEQVMTRQLRGRVDHDWCCEGLKTTLTLPTHMSA